MSVWDRTTRTGAETSLGFSTAHPARTQGHCPRAQCLRSWEGSPRTLLSCDGDPFSIFYGRVVSPCWAGATSHQKFGGMKAGRERARSWRGSSGGSQAGGSLPHHPESGCGSAPGPLQGGPRGRVGARGPRPVPVERQAGSGVPGPPSAGPRKEPLHRWRGALAGCRGAAQDNHRELRVCRVGNSGQRSGLQLHRETPTRA